VTAMKALLTAAALLVSSIGCLAGAVAARTTMQAQPNSIWFDQAAQLARWQKLKKGGDAAALASYQDKLLGQRDAWQFIYTLSVKVLGYDAKSRQVHVKMLTEGRFAGLDFYVDAGALGQ
jgi:hypothetical protein